MKHTAIYKVLLTVVLSFAVSVAYAQKMEVTGKVTDERGEPMPGVGVVDKNNPKNGTVTDLDGLYKIKVAKDGFLEFSFISYTSADIFWKWRLFPVLPSACRSVQAAHPVPAFYIILSYIRYLLTNG